MDTKVEHIELPDEGLAMSEWSSLQFTNAVFAAPLPQTST